MMKKIQYNGVIDEEILEEVKNRKSSEKYPIELAHEIYELHHYHKASYRNIMEYCDRKYGNSPSLGHIKKLIHKAEKELQRREQADSVRDDSLYIDDDEKDARGYENMSLEEYLSKNDINKLRIQKTRSTLKKLTNMNDKTITHLVRLITVHKIIDLRQSRRHENVNRARRS